MYNDVHTTTYNAPWGARASPEKPAKDAESIQSAAANFRATRWLVASGSTSARPKLSATYVLPTSIIVTAELNPRRKRTSCFPLLPPLRRQRFEHRYSRWHLSPLHIGCACAQLLSLSSPRCAPSAAPLCDPTAPLLPTRAPSRWDPTRAAQSPISQST